MLSDMLSASEMHNNYCISEQRCLVITILFVMQIAVDQRSELYSPEVVAAAQGALDTAYESAGTPLLPPARSTLVSTVTA
jgi:hypothetical protein